MTFYYATDNSNTSNNSNHLNYRNSGNFAPQPLQEQIQQEPQFRSNISNPMFPNDNSWLITPLSPPLSKKENLSRPFASNGPIPQFTTSTSYTSQSGGSNHRRSSNTWHTLWSSSTWQPNSFEKGQTPPIDLDFLEPSQDEQISPTRNNGAGGAGAGAATPSTAALNDYFQFKEGVLNQSQTISSPLNRRPYQHSPGFIPSGDEYFNHHTRERSASIWTFDLNNHSTPIPNKQQEERRHSIAVFSRPLTPPPQPQQQQKIQQLIHQVQQQQKIDEYFSPTTTMIDVQALGKGMLLSQLGDKQLIYQVQFKVKHRSEFFYTLSDEEFKVDDMVVVEADRGYDLGMIVSVVETKEQRKKKKLVSNEVTIKRIFRHANPSELVTFELKKQDEQKALVICQAKIKQKGLNMEVVDAEYQWDRRKLTFYFKSNERIDFRELVRELFKIYKTRIWMCASSSNDI